MRHWADLEGRVRAAATGEKGQPTKLFEEALMLVARTRSSLGQVGTRCFCWCLSGIEVLLV